MKSYKKMLIFLLVFGILGMTSVSTTVHPATAAAFTLYWEGYPWYCQLHSTSSMWLTGEDYLRFEKSANYHAQARIDISDVPDSDVLEVSVDLYGDRLNSWSWAPVLKVEWTESDYVAVIRNADGSYAHWKTSDYNSGWQSGKMYEDRWYTMKIRYEKLDNGKSNVLLAVRDVTNDDLWDVLYSTELTYRLQGDMKIYLGTELTYDYSSPGWSERYWYKNFRCYYWNFNEYTPVGAGTYAADSGYTLKYDWNDKWSEFDTIWLLRADAFVAATAYAEAYIYSQFTTPSWPTTACTISYRIPIVGKLQSMGLWAKASIHGDLKIYDSNGAQIGGELDIIDERIEGGLKWGSVPIPIFDFIDRTTTGSRLDYLPGGQTFTIRLFFRAYARTTVSWAAGSEFKTWDPPGQAYPHGIQIEDLDVQFDLP